MKKLTAFLLIGCLLFSLGACGMRAGTEKYTTTLFDIFDTVISITAYDTDQAAFDAHVKAVGEELERYDQLYDIYQDYDGVNNLYTINEAAGKSAVKTDAAVLSLLSYGKEVYAVTGGKVNIAAGAVLQLWHEARENAKEHPEAAALPDSALLKEAAKHTDINALELDEAQGTVFLRDEAMRLDVGAIAKGYAAEQLRAFLKENQIWENYLISLGGNVITAGKKQEGAPSDWTVQIESPRRELDFSKEIVRVTDNSVVTSGDYQRYFTVNGTDYCHIIDLETLMPAQCFASVTVICENSALADALSTALFLLPPDEGKALAAAQGAQAMWVDKSGNITYTEGYPKV